MPTQDQNFTVDFGQGLDTKTDPKQVLPSKMTTLKNRVFTKPRQLKKVFGFDQKTVTTTAGGTLSTAYRGFAYHDELLMDAGDAMYGYSPSRDLWKSKGIYFDPCQPTTTPLIKNSYNQSQMDVAIAGNYICYVWADSRGGLRYQIEDLQSGSLYVADSQLVVSAAASRPRVCAITTTKFAIIYNDGTNINGVLITTPTMTTSNVSMITGLDSQQNGFDISCVQGSYLIVVNIGNTSGRIDATKWDTSLGLSSSASPIDTIAHAMTVSCLTDTLSSNAVFIGVGAFDFTALVSEYKFYGLQITAALGVVFTNQLLNNAGTFGLIDLYYPRPTMTGTITSSGHATWFFDVPTNRNNLTTALFAAPAVYSNTINNAGNTGAMALFHSNCLLASRIFTTPTGTYVNVVHADTAQGTLFCVNVSSGIIAARLLPEQAGDHSDYFGVVPSVINTATNVYRCVTQFKNKIVTSAQTTFTVFGLSKIDLNFDATLARQSVLVNNQLLISGGVTRTYDGVSPVEHGFHLYPEIQSISEQNGSLASYLPTQMPVTVTTAGAVGTKQVWTLGPTCDAFYLKDGQNIKFSSAADANKYQLWFSKEPTTFSPAAGYTPIECRISANFTSVQIGEAIYDVLKAAGLTGVTFTIAYNAASCTLTFTNSANGTCTAPVSTAAYPAFSGSGTLLYRAVYEWQDNAGNLHRSSPSLAVSAAVPSASDGNLLFIAPLTLTDKKTTRSDVSVVIYRTATNGTTFYRVSSPITPVVNVSSGASYVTFMDILPDSTITSNEILYTDGGVLSNSCPPSTTVLFKNRNRVWLYSPEQKQLWYSKQIVNGVGISFSDLFTLSVDATGEDVIAINELDDKVIFFKKSQPLFTAGDGPNDTGQGQAFSLPVPIVAPAGCSDVNSVIKIPNGLIYKSQRGFFFLNRNLQTSYLGAAVESFNSSTCLAATALPDFSQVRFLMSSNDFLIYDYEVDQWSQRTVSGTVADAFIWKNQYVIVKTSALVWVENQSSYRDNAVNIQTTAETGWIHLGGIEGFQRVKYAVVNAGYVSSHVLKVEVGYDYNTTYGGTDTYQFTASADPIRFKIHLRQQKCTAIRFRITDLGVASGSYNEGNTLTNLTLVVGVKPGVAKLAAANRG